MTGEVDPTKLFSSAAMDLINAGIMKGADAVLYDKQPAAPVENRLNPNDVPYYSMQISQKLNNEGLSAANDYIKSHGFTERNLSEIGFNESDRSALGLRGINWVEPTSTNIANQDVVTNPVANTINQTTSGAVT